jgi:hypothetical protein
MYVSIKVLLHPPPYVSRLCIEVVVVGLLHLMGPIVPTNNQTNLIINPCTCPTISTKKNLKLKKKIKTKKKKTTSQVVGTRELGCWE